MLCPHIAWLVNALGTLIAYILDVCVLPGVCMLDWSDYHPGQ